MSISMAYYTGKLGYQVRVTRDGKTNTKYFTSKRKARQYERELLEELGPVPSRKGIPRKSPPTNTGIKRIVRRIVRRAGRQTSHVYTVYWRTADGQPRHSDISIDHWGRKKALNMAKRKKREMDATQLETAKPKRSKRRLR